MKVKQRLEIRGREPKTSQKGNDYIIARVEDIETGEPYELYDGNAENLEFYRRGKEADFILNLTQYRGSWQVQVDSFMLVKDDE